MGKRCNNATHRGERGINKGVRRQRKQPRRGICNGRGAAHVTPPHSSTMLPIPNGQRAVFQLRFVAASVHMHHQRHRQGSNGP